MKRIISLLVVMAMMLASVLAIIPVSATGSISSSDSVAVDNNAATETEKEIEITRFVSEEAYNAFKDMYDGGTISAPGDPNGYVRDVTPFAFGKAEANAMFANKRILSIYIPVVALNTPNSEDEGKVRFTITVLKADKIDEITTPVRTIEIKVDPATITAGKMNKIDLTSYDIVVGEDETIVFGEQKDTLKAYWYGGGGNFKPIAEEKAPHTLTIYGWAGKKDQTNAAPQGNHIFLDFDMVDATAGLPVYDEAGFNAMEDGKTYFLANDITVAGAKNITNVTFNGNGKTITLSGANGLFANATNSTVKNLTLAGGTTTYGVANVANGVTFKNVIVDLAAITVGSTDNAGAFVSSARGNVTVENCVNNTTITGNNAGAVVGQAQSCGDAAKLSIIGFVNNGALKGGTTSGLAVAYNCDGGFTEITVKDSTNLGASSANWAAGFIGAMHRSSANVKFENCVNGKEGSASTAEVKAGGTGAAGFIMEGYTATYTVNNCKNYANINGASGQAGAIFGKINGTISVDTFYNSGNVTANNTAAALAGWYASGSSFIAKNVTNLGTISANNWAAGMIGANYAAGTKLINCVNGEAGNASKGAISGNCAKKGGFVSESTNALEITGCTNYATIGSSNIGAGFVAINNAALTIDNSNNYGKVTGSSGDGAVGGFVGKSTQNITISNSANYGELSGSGVAGGIVGLFDGAKFVARNVTTDYKHNVGGGWNREGGGFIGAYWTDNTAELYFTDCVNKVSFNGNGGNPGGFVGGGVYGTGNYNGKDYKDYCFTAKKIAFLRCVNLGDNKGGGNRSGFLGQAKATDLIFIECINAGDMESTNANTVAGFVPWGHGYSTMTFIDCINTGDMKATAKDKFAAGFVVDTCGAKVTFNGCANFGTLNAINTEKSYAAGFVTTGSSPITIINSFNAGTLIGTNTSDYALGSNTTVVNSFGAGNNKDIIKAFADVDAFCYGTMVKQDKFAALKAAVEAKDVAAVTALLDDINTYIVSAGAADIDDPSLKISVNMTTALEGDYVALVKKDATDAVITVLVKDITENFDLFTVAHNGLEAGTYDLKLCRADGTVLHAKEIEIAVNLIMTAEQFMAMANQTGDYVLGADIAVAGDIWFAGNFNGAGHTIALTGTTGLFKYLNGDEQTIKNFTLEAAYIDNGTFSYGVIYSLKGDVTVENVHVGAITVQNGDRAAAVITTVDSNPFNDGTQSVDTSVIDIVVKNVTSEASVYGNWIGAGIVGRVYGNSLTLENVVNNGAIVSSTQNHSSTNFGTGGLLCDISTNTLTLKNVENHANLVTVSPILGGIAAQVGGNVTIESAINTGSVTYTAADNDWSGFTGGIIGFIRNAGTVTITDAENTANLPENAHSNKGGIIGGTGSAATVTLTRCINRGNVLSKQGNANGGLIGQSDNATVKIVDSANYGKVTATWIAGGLASKLKSIEVYNSANYGEVNAGGGAAAGIVVEISATGTIGFACCEDHKSSKDAHCSDKFVANYGNVTGANAAGIFRGNGQNDGKSIYVVNCINEGKITGTNGIATGIGWRVTNVSLYFVNCVNKGELTATGAATGMMYDTWGNNLHFIGCENNGKITSTDSNASGMTLSAAWTTKFIDCTNNGDIVAKGNAVGFGYSGNGPRTYENCVNNGNITSLTADAAGILMSVAEDEKQTVNVTDCVNNGNITAAASAGGIATKLEANKKADKVKFYINFIRCINNGDVTTTSKDVNHCIAGIAGNFSGVNSATFDTCVNNGDIACPVGDASGIAGWGGSTAPLTFKDCANYGVISGGRAEVQITYIAGMTNKTFEGTQIEGGNTYDDYVTNLTPIWTAEDFMNMGSKGMYILMDNIILPEDYTAKEFGANVYQAIFDGNGKTIYMKGLNTALFSKLLNAEIRNLTLVGNINANAVIANTATGNVTIDNVVVDVDINANGDAAGFITKATAGLTITDSKFLGNITATGKAAGIAVEAAGNITLDDVTVGDVGLTTAITGTDKVGGLFVTLANATANITDTVNFAAVTQSAKADGIIGGLIAEVNNTNITLDRCENYGKVNNRRETSNGEVEGTAGLIGMITNNSNATILSSTNYADVDTGYSVAGGLVGVVKKSSITIGSIDENGDVSDGSANHGNVSIAINSWTFGIGGIIGATDDTNGTSIKVYDTVNYGDVSIKGGNAGGILGFTNSGSSAIIEVIGCANYGAISSTVNNRVGGILGQVIAATIRVKDTTNFGSVSAKNVLTSKLDGDASATKYDKDAHVDTCHVAGIRPEHWTSSTTVEFINCANFGTLTSTNTSVSGITTRVNATNGKIENCVNYGTIIGPLSSSGIIAVPGSTPVTGCANYGLIVNNDNGAQVAPGADATNVAAGAIVSNSDLAKIAKNINATDYIMKNLDDLIGTSATAEVDVDLTALAYLAYDENGVVGDLDRYFDLDLTDNSIVADATNEGDYADLTAVLARTYAAKLARVSTETTFELTFNAKVTGTDAGFVYAIAPNATAHTLTNVFAAFDAEDYVLTNDGYAQFKVEYNGLFATISVLVDLGEGEEWYEIETVLLEDGAYAAIGVVNGASANVYDDEGALVTSYVDNAQIATVADVNFEISYMVGGIVNAFKALDRLAADLADAQFEAADHADALNKATTAKEAAKQVLDDAEALVDQRTTEYADAVASITVNMTPDEINALLNPYREALNAAMKAEAEATRAYNLTVAAYDNAAANEALAADDYAALAAFYEDDVKDAYADIATAIDEAINYADLIDAMLAIYKLGDKFEAKYSDEVINTVNTAVMAAINATTQEELDAQVEIINSYLTALDWAEFNYYVEVVNSLVEEDYTIFSWADFVEACEAIDGPDSYETQADVDAAVDAIIAALALLKDDIYQAAELQEYLNAAIAEREYWNAEETNENYTANSWLDFYNATIKPFQDAIDALEDLTDGSQFNTLEADLIAKYEAFKTAYAKTDRENALISIVEINALRDKALDAISEDPSVAYSDITKLYLLAALPEAERAYALIAEADAVRDYEAAQAAVDAAIAAYAPVTNGLVDVDAVIEAIATYTAEVEGKVYTVETWNDFELALATAEFVVVTAKSDEEAAEALAALTAAFDALVEYVEVNLDTLNNAIATAEALNKADYTKDSWDALRDAILNAKLAAYSDDQATIDAAYAALVDAMDNGLVKMPTTDALEALIAEVAALNSADYTAETWLNAALALQAAKAALKAEAQTEVDDAKAALTAAKAALVKKAAADNSALKALITEIEALNSADYTEETWADLQAALTAAKAALTSDKQADLDIAKATLAAAKAGLDKVVVEEEKTEVKTEETAPVETEKKGCKSAIGATVVVMTAVLGLGATVVLKKKED